MIYMAYVDSSVPAEDGRKGVMVAQNVTGTKFISDSKWSYAAFDGATGKPYFSATSVRAGAVRRREGQGEQAGRRRVLVRLPAQQGGAGLDGGDEAWRDESQGSASRLLPPARAATCPALAVASPAARGPVPGHPPHHRGAAPVLHRRGKQLPCQRGAPLWPSWKVAAGGQGRLWWRQPGPVIGVCAGRIHQPGLHPWAHAHPACGVPGESSSKAGGQVMHQGWCLACMLPVAGYEGCSLALA